MAINLEGLPIVPGARTLTSGGPPIALNNEIRGGIHRISGATGDQLGDIDARYLQAGMLVYNEGTSQYFMYRNVGTPDTGNPDTNDPYRGADGRLPNNVGTIGADDSNWIEFRLSPEQLNDIGDVFAASPTNGQVLEYRTMNDQGEALDNPGWYPSEDNVINSLRGLSDVTYNTGTSAPAIGDILQVVSTTDGNIQWENATKGPLGSLDDVSFPIAPTHTQVLEYRTDIFNPATGLSDITGWTSRTQIFGEEGGVFIDGTNAPANGQVLAYRDRDPVTDAILPVDQRGWYPAADSPLNNSIESLSDVNANLRPVGSILQYTGTANGWEDVLFNLGTLENLAQYDHLVYDGTQWLNEANHTPQYPTDQLPVQDTENAGQFIPQDFLYELRVDLNADGTRSVSWMETPGTVEFSVQDRPEVDEGVTAFRTAPSTYVVRGTESSPLDSEIDSIGGVLDNIGPMVWGQPLPRSTALFPSQPALWFFGQKDADPAFLAPDLTTNFMDLIGRDIHITIDYNGVVRGEDDETLTTTLAADDPVLAPLRDAIPPGEYTGTTFAGRTYLPSGSFSGVWWVGFTELRDRFGVIYRVPEPPEQDQEASRGGVHFGSPNAGATPPIDGTSTTVTNTVAASTTPSDPLMVFEHGGALNEVSVAGSPFIGVTRIDPTAEIPYPIIQVAPDSTNPEVGIAALANDGSVVTNPSVLDARTSGIGQNRFPQVSAGTGIELRGTADNLEIVNTFQEQDSDTTFARTTQSLARDGGVLTQEYVRGNSSTNTTDFFRLSGGTNGVDYERSLTYGRTPGSTDNAQLIFNFLIGPRGTPSPFSATDIVRLRVGAGVDNALVLAGLVPGEYTAIVTAVGGELPGPTAELASYQITLDNIKRQSGGIPLEGPATTITVAAANIEENDIDVGGLTLIDNNNLDNFDPFLLVQHSPNEAENSAIRFVGGNEISVEQTQSGVITINNTGSIPLFQPQHDYVAGEVFYTNEDENLIPTPGDRNKIFRVGNNFRSGTSLSTLDAIFITPVGDGAPGRASYQLPDQTGAAFTNVTLRGGDIIDLFDGQPTVDRTDPDNPIVTPANYVGSYMYSGTFYDSSGPSRIVDFPLLVNTGQTGPSPQALNENFVPLADRSPLPFLTAETDGISNIDFHDGFNIATSARVDEATTVRTGAQYSTPGTTMLVDINPITGVSIRIQNLRDDVPAVSLNDQLIVRLPALNGIAAGDYRVRVTSNAAAPTPTDPAEWAIANEFFAISNGAVNFNTTFSIRESDFPVNVGGVFEFLEVTTPAVGAKFDLTTENNGTYQFTPEGMTLASGGFLLRTESSAAESNQISQTGDIVLAASGHETLELFGTGWTINFDPSRSNPFDFTTLQIGDAIIMRTTEGNTANNPTLRNLVTAGDYLLIVNRVSENANVLHVDNRSFRRINADGSLQNHVGGVQTLAVFSLPFPADSLTFFRGHYESEFQVSTTNNNTVIGFNDRGIRTNGVVDIGSNFLSSSTVADNFGTAISTTYPTRWELLYTPNGTAIFRVIASGGTDFNSINLGDRFLIRINVADTTGHIAVGNYYAVRTNNRGTEGNDREIWFDPNRIFTINADNSIGDRVPLNNVFLDFANSGDYTFATLSILPELQIDLHDGTIYEFDEEGIFITQPGGTRMPVGGGDTSGLAPLNSPNFTGTPTAPNPDIFSDGTQIATTSFVHDIVDVFPVTNLPSQRQLIDPNVLTYSLIFWRPHLISGHANTFRLQDIDIAGQSPISIRNNVGTVITDQDQVITVPDVNAEFTMTFDRDGLDIIRTVTGTTGSHTIDFQVRFNFEASGDRTIYGITTGDGSGDTSGVATNHHDIVANASRIDSNASRIAAIENELHGNDGFLISTSSSPTNAIPAATNAASLDEVINYGTVTDDNPLSTPNAFPFSTTFTSRTDAVTGGSTALPEFVRNQLNTALFSRLERIAAYERTDGSAGDRVITQSAGELFLRGAAVRFGPSGRYFPLTVTTDRVSGVNHHFTFPAPFDFNIDTYTTIECRWFLNDANTAANSTLSSTLGAADLPSTLLVPIQGDEVTDLTDLIESDTRVAFVHWEDSAGTRHINIVSNILDSPLEPAEVPAFDVQSLLLEGTTGTLTPRHGSSIKISEAGQSSVSPPRFGVGVDGVVPGPSQAEVDAGNRYLNADGTWDPIEGTVPAFGPGQAGIVSAPGANESMEFLRGDNTFHPVLTEIPLHAKVNRLFLGTAGTMQTNAVVNGILGTFNYTPYTVYEGPTGNYDATFNNTYYFVEGISIAISGTGDRVFTTGNTDGIWTTDNPADGVLTTANAVNLVG